MYYITICTKNREKILSNIEINPCRGRVPPLPNNHKDNVSIIQKHTETGKMVENAIKKINQINNVKLNNYVIMPNHIHFIVILNNIEGRGGTLPLHNIIGRFKSFTTKQYNLLNKTIGVKLWQRNYFEHIIRNEEEYYKICEYIENNHINYIN